MDSSLLIQGIIVTAMGAVISAAVTYFSTQISRIRQRKTSPESLTEPKSGLCQVAVGSGRSREFWLLSKTVGFLASERKMVSENWVQQHEKHLAFC
jgi:hypothetical protein